MGTTAKRTSQLRYIDEFLKLSSAPAMLEAKLFPNSKEISESMAAYKAFRYFLAPHCADFSDEDAFVVVGDGATPRTAALFAFLTKGGTCYAIDPLLKDSCGGRKGDQEAAVVQDSDVPAESEDALAGCAVEHPWQHVRRLKVVPFRVEKVKMKVRRMVVVMVHCHCSLQQVMDRIEFEECVGLVTAPCCNWGPVQQALQGLPPVACYQDPFMLSDRSDVRIWCSDREACSAAARRFYDSNSVHFPDVPVPGTMLFPAVKGDGEGDGADEAAMAEANQPRASTQESNPRRSLEPHAARETLVERSRIGGAPKAARGDGEREITSQALSEEVVRELEREFAQNPHLNRPRELFPVAQRLGVGVFEVRVWFKHQREQRSIACDRRQGRTVKEGTLIEARGRQQREDFRASFVAARTEAGSFGSWPERGAEVAGFREALACRPKAEADAAVQRLLLLWEPHRVNFGPHRVNFGQSGEAPAQDAAEAAAAQHNLPTNAEAPSAPGGSGTEGGREEGEGDAKKVTAAEERESLSKLGAVLRGEAGWWWEDAVGGAWRAVGRVRRRRYKLRMHPAELFLQDRRDGADDDASLVRVLISRHAMPCAEEAFQQLLSSIRVGDIVEVAGLPLWTATAGLEGWGLYAWGLRLMVRRVGDETVYQV